MTPIEMGRSRFLTMAPDVPQSQASKKVHNSLFPIACPGPGGRTESLELPPDGRKSAPEKFESAARCSSQSSLPSCPLLAPSLGKAPCRRTPHMHSFLPPKHSQSPKVSSETGSPGGGGDKLPFLRTKTKSNSRGLIGKSQSPPPHTNGTGPHRYPVRGPY